MSTLAKLLEADPNLDAEGQLDLLGVKLEEVMAELAFRRQAKIAAAYRQQALAAKAGGTRRILRGEIGGEVKMAVHPIFYHYWGQRLGYACWDDDQFVREFLRDNPSARVKSVSNRLTIVKPEMNSAPNKEVGARAAAAFTARQLLATPSTRGVTGRRGRWAA